MTYSSTGPKPFERASKASHHHIVNDAHVQALLGNLFVPPREELSQLQSKFSIFTPVKTSITAVMAIDGGYTEVPLRKGFPAAGLHFFQFGALLFKLEDLKKLEISRHPDPDDMSRLKRIDRVKLALPTRNARRHDSKGLTETVRRTIYEFLWRETLNEGVSLLDTLAWFLYRQYKGPARKEDETVYVLTTNPCAAGEVVLAESKMSPEYTFKCPISGQPIYLSDAFRLHERIDDDTGAAGICGYLAGIVEHLLLLHAIRILVTKVKGGMDRVLFIMDRPTGFFGVTSRLIEPMFALSTWLFEHHNLYLAGLEKSGAFVEHAQELQQVMPNGSYLILGNAHIYKYITPPSTDVTRPYADTSYYGHKLIFKTRGGQMYVVSVPVHQLKSEPTEADLPRLRELLTHIEELRCDMYENALLPVALANKLVSLSAHPSTRILEAFAKTAVGS